PSQARVRHPFAKDHLNIQLALDSLSKQIKPNISKTAREFAVPMYPPTTPAIVRWKITFLIKPNDRKLNPI
ncbi:hypothetical protein N7447_002173, partial [Penicillium robsamsonii]|uniref:uncharacterized protein n=1 Tax=Penicillium robsamsonii TaxID=1792511 RepID=UPI002546AAA9